MKENNCYNHIVISESIYDYFYIKCTLDYFKLELCLTSEELFELLSSYY